MAVADGMEDTLVFTSVSQAGAVVVHLQPQFLPTMKSSSSLSTLEQTNTLDLGVPRHLGVGSSHALSPGSQLFLLFTQ